MGFRCLHTYREPFRDIDELFLLCSGSTPPRVRALSSLAGILGNLSFMASVALPDRSAVHSRKRCWLFARAGFGFISPAVSLSLTPPTAFKLLPINATTRRMLDRVFWEWHFFSCRVAARTSLCIRYCLNTTVYPEKSFVLPWQVVST